MTFWAKLVGNKTSLTNKLKYNTIYVFHSFYYIEKVVGMMCHGNGGIHQCGPNMPVTSLHIHHKTWSKCLLDCHPNQEPKVTRSGCNQWSVYYLQLKWDLQVTVASSYDLQLSLTSSCDLGQHWPLADISILTSCGDFWVTLKSGCNLYVTLTCWYELQETLTSGC